MNDFKEPNGTMKKIIKKHKSDFVKSRKTSTTNINTNTFPIQMNLVNPVNNIRDDPRSNIAFYPLKKIQQ
jgi:hypothetical protein